MPDNEIDLKRAFDRAGGSAPSAPAALAGLRTRIRKAHQRHAVARGGAGLLGLVAVGGVIMNIGGDDSGTDGRGDGSGPVGQLPLHIDDPRLDVRPGGIDHPDRDVCIQLGAVELGVERDGDIHGIDAGADDGSGDDERRFDAGDDRVRADDSAVRWSGSGVHGRGRHHRRGLHVDAR